MFCALLGQDIRCAFTGPLVLWFLLWNHAYLNNRYYLGLTLYVASDLRVQCPRVGLGVKILNILDFYFFCFYFILFYGLICI